MPLQQKPYSIEDWEKTKVGKFHKPRGPINLSDYSVTRLIPHPRASLKIETEAGIVTLDSASKFEYLFRKKYNFTFWKNAEIEAAFRFFSPTFPMKIFAYGISIQGPFIITWYNPQTSIMLGVGKEKRYLINLKDWCVNDWSPQTLEEVELAASKLIRFSTEFFPINPISPSTTVTDILLRVAENQFYYMEKFGPKILHEIFSTVSTFQRMETTILGTIDNQENEDMIKAFLVHLMDMPSTARGNIRGLFRTAKYHEDAHPGSLYKIRLTVPPGKYKLPPIPLGSIYPEGEFETVVCKPHIELLEELKIDYKIIESLQLRLKKIDRDSSTPEKIDSTTGLPESIDRNRPFEDVGMMIGRLEDLYKEELWPLNLKRLHYTIVGHMLHIHAEYTDLDTLPHLKGFKTSKDFNPFLAFGIQSIVSCNLWRKSDQSENPTAIRVDAISAGSLSTNGKGFKKEREKGLMTFLTPYLKDLPGKSRYRNLIYEYRDSTSVKIKGTTRVSLWNHPGVSVDKLGKEYKRTITITPYTFPRVDELDLDLKLGYLLDRDFPLLPPNLSDSQRFMDLSRVVGSAQRVTREISSVNSLENTGLED